MSIQYLWLFQKLNTASIVNIDMNAVSMPQCKLATSQINELNIFRFFSAPTVTSTNMVEQKSNLNAAKRKEQTMHLRAMITIYLANSLVLFN